MTATRTVGRSLVAAIGLIALTVFAALPAEGFRARTGGAEPVVGGEQAVSYPVLGSPQYGGQPAIAFGGSVYLAAWRVDGRGIVVARVDRAGTVIDVSGITLSDGPLPDDPFLGSNPDVAFDGTNFLVVWEGVGAVLGKRVGPDGHVLDDAPIRLSTSPGQSLDPAVDFDGTNYFVVWRILLEGDEITGDVYGTRVSPGGVDLDPADRLVAAGVVSFAHSDVAFNGTHHLVVWADPGPAGRGDIFGTLVTTAGVPLNPLGIPISTAAGNQSDPVVASIGTSFFVAWEDARGGDDTSAVYGARVDASGAVLDPAGIAVAAARYPSIASDGAGVLVATYGGVTRVDASGTVVAPSSVPLPFAGLETAVAFDGDNYFAIGWDTAAIRGARVTRQVTVLDPLGITVSMAANSQTRLDMAFDDTNHLVVWQDDRVQGAGPGLYGGRLGPDGQVLDGTGFPISTGEAEFFRPESVAVASDGTNFLVVWNDQQHSAVRAARVSGAGVVLDRFDVAVPGVGEIGPPEVAFGGGGYLVTWMRSVFDRGYRNEVRGARVSTDGQVVDPSGFVIASFGSSQFGPPPSAIDVAYGATNFLVVFTQPQTTFGARVMTQGPGPVPPPEVFRVSTAQRYETDPRIAWNGTTHLVVWASATSDSLPPRPTDISGARVDDAGTVLDPSGIAISTAPGDQRTPTVAANGPFLVTWNDRRRGVETEADLYATRVDADGTVGHPDGFLIATDIRDSFFFPTGAPVAAAVGQGNFTVAYERFIADEPYGSTRAFVRDVSPK